MLSEDLCCCSREWTDAFFFLALEDAHEMGKAEPVDMTKVSGGAPRYISERLGGLCLHKVRTIPLSRFHTRGSSTMMWNVASPFLFFSFLPHTLVLPGSPYWSIDIVSLPNHYSRKYSGRKVLQHQQTPFSSLYD